MSSFTDENSQVPEMLQNLELLNELPFFSSFPAKAMKLLAFLAKRVRLADGDVLFEEGDDHGRAYLILSGQLTLMKKFEGEEIVIKEYISGDFLGSFSLLGAMPALFLLQANAETTVLTISRKEFSKILEQFPETVKIALRSLLKELHQWERKNTTEADVCRLTRTGATVL